MRNLYLRSRGAQWAVAVALIAAGAVAIRAALIGVRGPLSLVLAPLLFPLAQISVAPLFRLVGVYRYHSAMLKVTIRTTRVYEIHGGTPFDYVLHLRWRDRGAPAARHILISYLEGLLDIADCVARGELPASIRITGTSYFFREASAARLGFALEKPTLRLRANLLLHLLDLTLLYSFARGRWALPPVWRTRNAVISGAGLLERRSSIESMIRLLRGHSSGADETRAALCA
jgi:hypothetical protein